MGTYTGNDNSNNFSASREGFFWNKTWKPWSIDGKGGDDILKGGDNDDSIKGGSGSDSLWGWGGHDYLNGGTGGDTIRGGSGDDRLFGAVAFKSSGFFEVEDALNEDGADLLFGEAGKDSLVGEAGSDFLDGGEQDDYLEGGTGSDTLIGGDGNDYLNGGGGWHYSLNGGGGTADVDVLTGGANADTFVLGQEYDGEGYAIITDFNWGEGDKIRVSFNIDEYTLEQSNTFGVGNPSLNDTAVFRGNNLIALFVDNTDVIPSADFFQPRLIE